jgi:hypothetical protein
MFLYFIMIFFMSMGLNESIIAMNVLTNVQDEHVRFEESCIDKQFSQLSRRKRLKPKQRGYSNTLSFDAEDAVASYRYSQLDNLNLQFHFARDGKELDFVAAKLQDITIDHERRYDNACKGPNSKAMHPYWIDIDNSIEHLETNIQLKQADCAARVEQAVINKIILDNKKLIQAAKNKFKN